MSEESSSPLAPPTSILGTVRFLGPGLIVAGAIVGSGELIMTTKTGAQAGISLLWLIILGCVIKVFVQVELGRYAITHGRTTLEALNDLPGPKLIVHPVLWLWAAMMAATVLQLGGIVGGVGQALALSIPITGDYRQAVVVPAESELKYFVSMSDARQQESTEWTELSEKDRELVTTRLGAIEERIAKAGEVAAEALETVRRGGKVVEPRTLDDRYWALAAALLTMGVLFNGRYGLIQSFSTVLVVLFTLATVANVVGLQFEPEWKVTTAELLHGLSFQLPSTGDRSAAIATALATFGIIGVGATELISYPYWCLERGYARYTGPRRADESWYASARGWLRVMRLDAFASMVVYTTATIAFFIIGVAVLHDTGQDPDGMRLVSTLAAAYQPVFGNAATWVFLFGAVAVLYSTFMIAIAAQTRIYTDAFTLFRLLPEGDERIRQRSISSLGVILPAICVLLYWTGLNPVTGVIWSGIMQGIMLPVLAGAAIYFRFFKTDRELAPSRLWDVLLYVSSLGLLVVGGWTIWTTIKPYVEPLFVIDVP